MADDRQKWGMESPDQPTSLLLVTHVPVRQGPGGPMIDEQTAAGIAQWCRHFDRVTFFGIADDTAKHNASTGSWVNLSSLHDAKRCELAALPRAYDAGVMLRTYGPIRAKLRAAVGRHRHLCFTLGSLFGDWPAVAAHEAILQGRGYAAWIDRVESFIIRNKLAGASVSKRLVGGALLPLIEAKNGYLLRRSTVALLQGQDTYQHHAASAPDPHCTYDTHTHISDQIAPVALAEKTSRIRANEPVRIIYVGRAAAMKGPVDWLDVLEGLHRRQVPFFATWVGDGPELPMMRQRLAESAIAGAVELPGFEGDREVLLRRMRDSDVMLFCHKTPESPRCLIEALVSGCPIVGYETAYPRGLVMQKGGGAFAPQDNVTALVDRMAELHHDRNALARLVEAAAASGATYNEDAVYAHRAELMKRAV